MSNIKIGDLVYVQHDLYKNIKGLAIVLNYHKEEDKYVCELVENYDIIRVSSGNTMRIHPILGKLWRLT